MADKTYTVQKGDNLWDLSKEFLGSGTRYKDVAKWNDIDNPSMIRPGQKINFYNSNKSSNKSPAPKSTSNNNAPTVANNQNTYKPNDALSDLENLIENNSDAFLENQKAILEQRRQDAITNLQKAYNDAVAKGEISIDEANEAFEKNVEAINEQAYQNAQRTNLVAQNRGIQNSQQLLGLQAGDNRNTMDVRNANQMQKQERVSDIKDRIKQITLQRDLDVANVESQYDTGLLSAQAQADQMRNTGLFNLRMDDYTANRDQNFALDRMDHQFDLDLQKMDKQHEYVLDQMEEQFGFDMRKMKTAHGYDLDKMEKQFGYDLKKMAKQYGYNKSLQQAQIASAKRAYAQRAQSVQNSYATAMARELAKYKKGTPEYNLRQKQLEAQRDTAMMNMHQKTLYEATAKSVLGGSSDIDKYNFTNDPMGYMNGRYEPKEGPKPNNYRDFTTPSRPSTTYQDSISRYLLDNALYGP